MKGLLLGYFILAAAGCKSGSQQQSGTAKGTPKARETETGTSPATAAGKIGALGSSPLEGDWVNTCGTFSEDPSTVLYQTGTKTFRGNEVTIAYQAYNEDKTCKAKSSALRTVGTFKLGKPAADGTMSFDFTPTATYFTFYNQDEVDNLNVDNACGGFEVGKEKKLVQATCGDYPNFLRSFSTIYGLVKLDGSTLYESNLGSLGSDDDGTTSTRRPKTVRSHGMRRQ